MMGDTAFSLVWFRVVPHRDSPVIYISSLMSFFEFDREL